ncbi:MAG: ATP-binding cassette domain-containing protein [Actinomycetota bacterium]|nr:ATP-binding cassette domain-containing protein [Actinomycetota bacterium]
MTASQGSDSPVREDSTAHGGSARPEDGTPREDSAAPGASTVPGHSGVPGETSFFADNVFPEDSPVAIRAVGLSKSYRLPHERRTTLRDYVVHPFRRTLYEEQRALVDVSLSIPRGEFFGVIGPNGSGKSTLLKLLAGIYRPDAGTVEVNGKLSPFIELGVGFNDELNARDNVRINATLLGLSPRELDERFDEIIEFAELERFVDRKLKNYSSGMRIRLAYSIAIQVPFDILLLDEVLAVGDQNFQEKCFATFEAMRESGKTVVFVTHDLASVRRFCHRSLLLREGVVQAIGPSDEVAGDYVEQERIRAAKTAFSTSGKLPGAEHLDLDPAAEKILEHERELELRKLMTKVLTRRHYDELPVPPPHLRNGTGAPESEPDFLTWGLVDADFVLEMIGKSPSKPVLEWGCRGGRVVRWLSCYPEWQRNYYGCDHEEEAISWLSSQRPLRLEVCADEPPLPYDDGIFGGVFSLEMLRRVHPRSHRPWFVELHRLLAPGGLVYITTNGPTLAEIEDKEAAEALRDRGYASVTDEAGRTHAFVAEDYVRRTVEGLFSVDASNPAGHLGRDAYLLRRLR